MTREAKNPLRLRILCMAATIVLAVFYCLPILSAPAAIAEDGPPSLEITVGNYGDSEYESRALSNEEIKTLPMETVDYTIADHGNRIIYARARGIKLETLIESVGVDPSGVGRIVFTASDGYDKDKANEFTMDFFFEQPRYYYPNLGPNWNYGSPSTGAEDGGVEVPPMLAFELEWHKASGDISPSVFTGDFSDDPDRVYRLMFGMRDVNAKEANRSVYAIRKMDLTLEGTTEKIKDGDEYDEDVLDSDKDREKDKEEDEIQEENEQEKEEEKVEEKQTEEAIGIPQNYDKDNNFNGRYGDSDGGIGYKGDRTVTGGMIGVESETEITSGALGKLVKIRSKDDVSGNLYKVTSSVNRAETEKFKGYQQNSKYLPAAAGGMGIVLAAGAVAQGLSLAGGTGLGSLFRPRQ